MEIHVYNEYMLKGVLQGLYLANKFSQVLFQNSFIFYPIILLFFILAIAKYAMKYTAEGPKAIIKFFGWTVFASVMIYTMKTETSYRIKYEPLTVGSTIRLSNTQSTTVTFNASPTLFEIPEAFAHNVLLVILSLTNSSQNNADKVSTRTVEIGHCLDPKAFIATGLKRFMRENQDDSRTIRLAWICNRLTPVSFECREIVQKAMQSIGEVRRECTSHIQEIWGSESANAYDEIYSKLQEACFLAFLGAKQTYVPQEYLNDICVGQINYLINQLALMKEAGFKVKYAGGARLLGDVINEIALEIDKTFSQYSTKYSTKWHIVSNINGIVLGFLIGFSPLILLFSLLPEGEVYNFKLLIGSMVAYALVKLWIPLLAFVHQVILSVYLLHLKELLT